MTFPTGSLVEMIEQGTIAKIGLGASVRAVGETLGPPGTWERPWRGRVPQCWIYEDAAFYFADDEALLGRLAAISITPSAARELVEFQSGIFAFSGSGLKSCATVRDFHEWLETIVPNHRAVEVQDQFYKVYFVNFVRFEFHDVGETAKEYILSNFAISNRSLMERNSVKFDQL